MKHILTLILISASLGCIAQTQPKEIWIHSVSQYNYTKDLKVESVTYYLRLKGKDSVSVSIEKDNCVCSFYITYDGVKKPAKGLIRQYLVANQWIWEKSITIKGKDTISVENPHWGGRNSSYNFAQGVYTLNGKYIQPEYIITKHGKFKVD